MNSVTRPDTPFQSGHPPRHWRQARLWMFIAFLVVWALSAIDPFHPEDWILENVLTAVFVVFYLAIWRFFCLSPTSNALVFVFLTLHIIGSHYTYSEVPYDKWWTELTGSSLNSFFGFERNHYDRLVHFCYGLLLAYPTRELLVRLAGVRGFWGYFIPLDMTMSSSMIYELIEWAAAEFFGGDLGLAYLGTQGDVWDAHKDMALASLGAFISITIAWLLRHRVREVWAQADGNAG